MTYLEEYQAAREDVELPQWTLVAPQVVSIEEQALVHFGDIETFVDLRPTCIRTTKSLIDRVGLGSWLET